MSQRLFKAIAAIPQSPCEKGCSLYQECATKLISCEAFNNYAIYGRSTTRIFDDKPTSELFAKLERE